MNGLNSTKIIILLTLLLSGCMQPNEKQQTGEIQSIEVDADNIGNCEVWSKIIEDIEFIRLETNDSSVVGEIKKLAISRDRLIILTWDYNVFIFEKTGKLFKKLSNYGKGPLEIIRPRDLNISADGNLFILAEGKIVEFDISGKPLHEYLFGSGEEISSPINMYCYSSTQIYTWHTAIYTGNAENKYHLLLKDSTGKVIKKAFNYQHFSYGVESRFSQSGNNEIAITPPDLNDTIYTIKDGSIMPKYLINIKQNRKKTIDPLIGMTVDDFQLPDQLNDYLLKNKTYTMSHNVVFSNTFITFWIKSSGNKFRCFYDLKRNIPYVFSCYYIDDNTSIFYPESIYCASDNKFYSSINAWKIRQLLDKGQTSASFLPGKRRLELLEKLKDTKETDNPVLMIIKTKNQ